MPAPLNLVGMVFNRLTVIDLDKTIRVGINLVTKRMWRCRCSCGNIITVATESLRSGNTQSCGCWINEIRRIAKKTHGHTKAVNGKRTRSSEYSSWASAKARCYIQSASGYADYGARGITMCARWRDSFENFLADMGPKPASGWGIERDDVSKGYEPGNCRWIPNPEQVNNTRRTIRISLPNGQQVTLKEACRFFDVSHNRVYGLIRHRKCLPIEALQLAKHYGVTT